MLVTLGVIFGFLNLLIIFALFNLWYQRQNKFVLPWIKLYRKLVARIKFEISYYRYLKDLYNKRMKELLK